MFAILAQVAVDLYHDSDWHGRIMETPAILSVDSIAHLDIDDSEAHKNNARLERDMSVAVIQPPRRLQPQPINEDNTRALCGDRGGRLRVETQR